jgi:hypothetical protein
MFLASDGSLDDPAISWRYVRGGGGGGVLFNVHRRGISDIIDRAIRYRSDRLYMHNV